MSEFRKELENLINSKSKENGSNTPDFILAEYLDDCLTAFDKAIISRTKWYEKGRDPINDLMGDMKAKFKVGQRVFSIEWGYGFVKFIDKNYSPQITVTFDDSEFDIKNYYRGGFSESNSEHPSLFHSAREAAEYFSKIAEEEEK